MGRQALQAMTVEDYYAWGELQEDRYELVDGCPTRMMPETNRRHDQIVLNTLLAIGDRQPAPGTPLPRLHGRYGRRDRAHAPPPSGRRDRVRATA